MNVLVINMVCQVVIMAREEMLCRRDEDVELHCSMREQASSVEVTAFNLR